MVTEVLHFKENTETPTQQAGRNRLRRDVDELSHVDHVPTNASSYHSGSQLYIYEDNEAVIKNDYQRQKSNEETRVKDSQSCSRLVL